ncbi:MAG: ABC transporter ATP-binding protein [Bacteroidales bacterium]|nr:ABC transporter ATP-binding protein [Bacteroidales bacterium]
MIIRDLHKAYGKTGVLKGVDIDLPDARITAVLGPNGSGKTTLIKCILGMVIGQQGEITVGGRNIEGDWLYRRDIGYLPQIARFPENLRLRELIRMVKDIRNQPAFDDELISLFGLEPYLGKPLRYLSGGTRQKVNILIAFMFDCHYLILDEPTVGLDPLALIRFKDLLIRKKEAGKAILLTTHMVSLVEELADEVIFILEGKIYFQGKVENLKAQSNDTNLERAIAGILINQGHV